MVKYPIKKNVAKNTAKKAKASANGEEVTTVNAFSNRGMRLENNINLTCQFYLDNDIAVIHKKPTPIQVVKFRGGGSKYAISEAYYRQASTTDYNGIYRGRHIDFEAKETATHASFSLKNLPEHQIKHMLQVDKHGGIAFIIVGFWKTGEIFLMDVKDMAEYYFKLKVASISIKIFREKAYRIPSSYTKPADFLQAVDIAYFEKKAS